MQPLTSTHNGNAARQRAAAEGEMGGDMTLIDKRGIWRLTQAAGYTDIRDYAEDHDLACCGVCGRWGKWGEEIIENGAFSRYCEQHNPILFDEKDEPIP